MRNITIVFTAHGEMGLCCGHELLKILEAIDPEIVFEESRAADHESFYKDESKHTLEMSVLTEYRTSKSILQVPVDNFVILEGFKAGADELFDYVESNSKEYQEAFINIVRMRVLHGFPYLNSPKYLEMQNEADELFEAAVFASGSDRIKGLFLDWHGLLRRRELAMLNGIYDFSRNNLFSRGVFLVGCGHMSYFMKLIEMRTETEPGLINWRIHGWQ